MDVLPGVWSLSPLGALIGAVVILYWMLGTGRLIPRSSHERELEQANRRGDEWKDTALEQREINAEIRKQNSTLIEAARITTDFFGKVSAPDIEDTGVPHVGP